VTLPPLETRPKNTFGPLPSSRMKVAAIRKLRSKLVRDECVFGLWVTLDSASITGRAGAGRTRLGRRRRRVWQLGLKNAGVAPARVLGQFENQLADRLGSRSTTTFGGNMLLPPAPVPNPTTQRAWVYYRDDLVQCPAKLCGEASQPVFLFLSHRHPRRQLAAEDLVLDLEIADLPSEFLLRRAGDKQQRSVNVPHGANQRKLKRGKKMTSFRTPVRGSGGKFPTQRQSRFVSRNAPNDLSPITPVETNPPISGWN
jgi:hypothetical protein